MKKRILTPEAYLDFVRPSLPAAYQTALLITDSAEMAEDAVSHALLEVYFATGRGRQRRALRETLRKSVRECAFAYLHASTLNDTERGDWRGATGESVVANVELSALFSRFSQEDIPLQRYLLLRYGCGLSAADSAEAVGLRVSEAKEQAARFRSIAAGSNADAFDRALIRMCGLLATERGGAPDMSAVCRAFQRDAVTQIRGSSRRGNVPVYVLCCFGILICALLFWLVAVLLEPSGTPEAAPTAAVVSGALLRVFLNS